MSGLSLTRLEALEPWSPPAFIASGALWLGFVVADGVELVSAVTAPVLVTDALLLGGFLAAFVGLVGLAPRVADEAPELARAGTVFAAIGAVAHTVDRVAALLVSVQSGTPYGAVTTGLEPLYLVTLFCLLVSFLMFHRASVAAGRPSRTVSRLLLVPPAMLFASVLGFLVLPPRSLLLVVWAVIAVGWLALGRRLRTAEPPAEPSTDSGA